ncbi:hypothetical protein F7725_001241 [Dissostichus mawsoni]|uniref:Uncharacterized protein n=1 Tax=Dissostichus mawsoni TaxID=36200 RepID=A0A7J5ZH84_DISMA|nr:hypothetical protein F7725_001241 [Dissostichus mawsoni]
MARRRRGAGLGSDVCMPKEEEEEKKEEELWTRQEVTDSNGTLQIKSLVFNKGGDELRLTGRDL